MTIKKSHRAITAAYDQGYKAVEGKIISPLGNVLKICLSKRQEKKGGHYPKFGFRWAEINDIWKIEAHKFAAFCYYGEAALQPGIHVRHLNSNIWDITPENLALGTASDNARDKKSEFKTGTIRPPEEVNTYTPDDRYMSILDELKKKPLSGRDQALLEAYERGYRVDNDGTLRNPDGAILDLRLPKNGYPSLTIHHPNGKCYGIRVHRLAAFCFYGPNLFDEGNMVRHKNGNVLDISRNSILLGTARDNMMDVPETYRKQRGKAAGLVTAEQIRSLTDAQVRKIRRMLQEGVNQMEISRRLHISYHIIHDIRRRRTYKFVPDEE